MHSVLKAHGITDSVKGQKGGIRLARPLTQVNAGELVVIFDGGIEFSVCGGKISPTCGKKSLCRTDHICEEISQRMLEILLETPLSSILAPSFDDEPGL